MKHLLEIDDLTPADLGSILEKSSDPGLAKVGKPTGIALIFEMPSARTRNSVEMAAVQLGAHPVYIEERELGFDKRESVEDITHTLACYHDIVCARLHDHATLERMAALDVIPVVNLLSKDAHPLQALADLLTIKEEFGDVPDLKIAYLGYPGNVWRSLAMAAGLAGIEVATGVPEIYRPSEDDLARIKRCGAQLEVHHDPIEAVAGAHVVYTDRWVSMSDTVNPEKRQAEFAAFQVSETLMQHADPSAIFMHCLPAKRGAEVTEPVIDGPASRIWEQATNRMHTARGVFSWLLES